MQRTIVMNAYHQQRSNEYPARRDEVLFTKSLLNINIHLLARARYTASSVTEQGSTVSKFLLGAFNDRKLFQND